MNNLSEEILEKYQVRKTKQQKSEFIAFMQERISGLKVEEGGFPKSRNLVLGDVDTARVILSAHYDTCARLPFPNFITPKNLLLTILYNIVILILFFALLVVLNLLFRNVTDSFWLHYFGSFIAFFALFILVFMAGPPNKHTANDNTSGVIALCELMDTLSAEEKAQTAFVFFDNEENGLLGSAQFRSLHKNVLKEKLIINFDCVSDGDNILLVENKPVRKKHGVNLKTAFFDAHGKTVYHESASNTIYPSDQAGFPNSIAIAAMQKKPFVGLYMNKIHTDKDRVFDRTNISFICEGVKRFYSTL